MQRARAGRRRWAILSLLLALLAAAAPARARVDSPILSGLLWRSGATGGGFPCLAQLRDRPLDANTVYLNHDSFEAMQRQSGGLWARVSAKAAPLWVVSAPLLTTSTKGQFAQCGAGAFDLYWRKIGYQLKAAGAQGTVVRLGWEANIGSDNHPWGVDTAGQVPDYKRCWRRAATALKAGGLGLQVEWTSAKKTQNTAFTALDLYPGDDVVDVIGVHYYDSGPERNTQALWDEYYNITFNGGPWGLGTWLAFAREHGKQLGIAEWGGVGPGPGSRGGGRPGLHRQHVPLLPCQRRRHRLRDLLQRDARRARVVQLERGAHELPEGGGHVQGRLEPGRAALTPEARAQSRSRGRR